MQVRFRARRIASPISALSMAALVCACTTTLDGPSIDYRSEGGSKRVNLEVPPDLSQLPRDDRYTLPEASRSSATLSQVQPANQPQAAATNGTVAVNTTAQARIERDGNQRWLVVNLPPERVWTVVREFWLSNGFTFRVENREAGVLETHWAEDRARAPRDIVRRTLGSLAGNLFDTGERDLFRTRIERGANGTEVYISHRGVTEVLNQQKDGTIWQPRPSDPNLEAEFLQRLLVQFGNTEGTTKAALANNASSPNDAANAPTPPRARLVDGAEPAVVLDDPLERAWRRVGLSLDRTGFTVEERDRANGIYGVRFVEPEKPQEEGFLSRIFGSKKEPKAQQYRIVVRSDGNVTRVTMLDKDGKPVSAEVSRRVLKLLADDLR